MDPRQVKAETERMEVKRVSDREFRVTGERGNTYRVDYSAVSGLTEFCECPDAIRHLCKHQRRVMLELEQGLHRVARPAYDIDEDLELFDRSLNSPW